MKVEYAHTCTHTPIHPYTHTPIHPYTPYILSKELAVLDAMAPHVITQEQRPRVMECPFVKTVIKMGADFTLHIQVCLFIQGGGQPLQPKWCVVLVQHCVYMSVCCRCCEHLFLHNNNT